MKFISGLADCHLPGLYSLVISERESPSVGMRRVFYCGVDCNMELWDGADFRLKPHNHRQSIRLKLLFGEAWNVSLKFSNMFGQFATWRYKFGSALQGGEFNLERMNEDRVSDLIHKPITTEGVSLHYSDVHTVVAKPRTAWLVEEGELAPPGMERLWSVSHRLSMSSEGLYNPLRKVLVDNFSDKISEMLPERLPA